MSKRFVLLLFSFCSYSEAFLTCQVPGTCTGVYTDITILDSYDQCLDRCQGKERGACNWITFNDQNKVCLDYSDCPEIDQKCEVCTSGERDCVMGASCNLKGFCQGHVLSYNVTSSLMACQESCQALQACAWYSYHTDNSLCVLTSDCPTFDESCTNCVSGERACFEGEPSSTTSSSTTAASSTTTPLNPNPFNRLIINGRVINLGDDGKRCPYLTMPFDNNNYGIFLKDKLVVCGEGNSSCYSLAHFGQDWQLIGDKTPIIRLPGGVQMSDTEW